MTATTADPTTGPAAQRWGLPPLPGGTITRVPFHRLVAVEHRKLVDTRAGRGLAVVIAVLTVLSLTGALVVAAQTDLDLGLRLLLQVATVPTALLLPVLGILSVTGEWSQRTHMVTFALEPRRARVVAAKLVTGVVVATLVTLVVMALAALAHLVESGPLGGPTDWSLPLAAAAGHLAVQVLGLLTGFAFGMLLLSTPAAIVVYVAFAYLLPTLLTALGAVVPSAADVIVWFDLTAAQTLLAEGTMTARGWLQLATSGALWFLLPLGLGLARVLRADVK
ncbi:ABC-2 transporter permease [Auraticoccus monumenti]|uniref:ABC-type transport system involved in multi-copper enzyme maturation, permease component n=1 Tax=Auraticoccus monumenti TaxID=675864 RepID=A0A1G7BB18_9ACTN|nr:hypothetical protein [Auraticoccus monumenti]SDE24328.1 ABC-type transport system involved in multi-copper enzyme maturation, permease component [Auraticoccus monumenti]